MLRQFPMAGYVGAFYPLVLRTPPGMVLTQLMYSYYNEQANFIVSKELDVRPPKDTLMWLSSGTTEVLS